MNVEVNDTPVHSINDELANWAVDHNISHSAVNDLLNVLRTHHCFNNVLPKDSRTFLQTSISSKKIIVKNVHPGSYYHFGIESGIRHFYSNNDDSNSIKLVFGIDGLPISQSSGSCFWPILCYIRPNKDIVFPVGIYWGYKKPIDSNEFLLDFYEEMKMLLQNGIDLEIEEKNVHKTVILDAIICDAPAKSFVLKIKGHSGFFSCTRCETSGIYKKNRLCFPEIGATKRTHESFVNKMQEKHHSINTEMSILTNLPSIDIIKVFCLDYMHICNLGITRKLLRLWLGKGPKTVRINSNDVKKLSTDHSSLKNCVTSDFPRKPRTLEEINHWKATEFRQFLLYTGPVVLKSILNEKMYLNFLCIHISFTILLSPNLSKMINYCDQLLKFFINDFCAIYGTEQASHNIHALQHITEDYQNFGPLDNASAYPFENHMKILKKTVKKGSQPLQQAVKRYKEKFQYDKSYSALTVKPDICLKKQHQNGPLCEHLVGPQYGILIIRTFKINTYSKSDSFIMTKNEEIIKVLNICFTKTGHNVIVGKSFLNKVPFYEKPINSSKLSIYVVDKLSMDNKYYNINEIKCKCMVLTINNKLITFPVLHTSLNQ